MFLVQVPKQKNFKYCCKHDSKSKFVLPNKVIPNKKFKTTCI